MHADAYEVAIVPGVGYAGVQSLASAAIACGVPITKPAPPVGGNTGGDVGAGVEKNMARAAGGMLRQSDMGNIFGDGLQGGGRRAGAGGGGLAIADIGCGTGLCGEVFAMAAGGGGRLVGCDVSGRMASKAREKGVYE
jgi:SAM-dependent methyltransferase